MKTNPDKPTNSGYALADGPTSNRSTLRLKTAAGWTFLACMLGSTVGTVVGMMRSFCSIANGDQPVPVAELADSITRSVYMGMVFAPIGIIAAIIWLVCRHRLKWRATS